MKRPMLLFYIIVVYVFSSFIWWTILLTDKNNKMYKEKSELLKLTQPDNSFENSPGYKNLQKEHDKQKWMIIGEGAVFLLLILIGTIQLRKNFLHEINFNRQQKNFLLSVTHELRSPLASTKLTLQTLQKHLLSPERKQLLINNGLDDVDRLQKMVENLLLATRIEDHSFRIERENFNLSAITLEIVNKFMIANYQHEKNIKFDIDENISLHGDKTALQSVITNLIENAIKYAPIHSSIFVSLKEKNESILLSVTDEGPGIPLKERTRIFNKFYRLGNEDTRKTKGTGLGLFIVNRLLSLHHGTVTVRENKPSGSIFEVRLPKK